MPVVAAARRTGAHTDAVAQLPRVRKQEGKGKRVVRALPSPSRPWPFFADSSPMACQADAHNGSGGWFTPS